MDEPCPDLTRAATSNTTARNNEKRCMTSRVTETTKNKGGNACVFKKGATDFKDKRNGHIRRECELKSTRQPYIVKHQNIDTSIHDSKFKERGFSGIFFFKTIQTALDEYIVEGKGPAFKGNFVYESSKILLWIRQHKNNAPAKWKLINGLFC
jgi:hypothetical protein